MNLTDLQKLEILCAYLPYGVEVKSPSGNIYLLSTYSNTGGSGIEKRNIDTCISGNYQPILRHPDDMTEEEQSYKMKLWGDTAGMVKTATAILRYLHSIHIDTFGAIESGFAIRKTI
jgi:hypothetical protein